MIFVQPEQRVREQEVPDLRSPVVEDQRSPILMLALAGVRVLVQRGAIEAREAVIIFWKMTRHPVENDGEIGLMTRVDKVFEIFRRPQPPPWRQEAEHLRA